MSEQIDSTMQARRMWREQEQKLDQVAMSMQALWYPVTQMWATYLSLVGDNCIGMANLISRYSEVQFDKNK